MDDGSSFARDEDERISLAELAHAELVEAASSDVKTIYESQAGFVQGARRVVVR